MEGNIKKFLQGLGYSDLRVVGETPFTYGTLCALFSTPLSTLLVVGLDLKGYEHHFMYENEHEARVALHGWDGSAPPSGPWLRLHGVVRNRFVDVANPLFGRPRKIRSN